MNFEKPKINVVQLLDGSVNVFLVSGNGTLLLTSSENKFELSDYIDKLHTLTGYDIVYSVEHILRQIVLADDFYK